MRTVDPETWPKKLPKRPPLGSSRLDEGGDGLEMRLRKSLHDASREYLANTSMRGQARMADMSLSRLERWQHGVVWTLALCWGAYGVAAHVAAWLREPQQLVTRDSAHRSIQHIPFPAVALCSNNVIANGALHNLTASLYSHRNNTRYNASSIREHLLQFGSLLTMDLPDVDVNFMSFLVRADPNFNVTSLMATFSPSCATMLRRCSWQGKSLPCDLLFATRITPLGFCCVFNSRYYNEDVRRPPKYLDMAGLNYGLTVIVHENPEDFAYSRRASVGVDVLLFDGNEYPILEGGGVRIYPLDQNTSAFLSVRAIAQQPSGPVRGCRQRGPEAWPSYSRCLTECRRRTLASLCSCRLHTLPPDPTDKTLICSLIHLPCLNKHREKLIYYFPHGYSTSALAEELQNGQVCEECTPDCSRYVYSATVNVATRFSRGFGHKLFRRLVTAKSLVVNTTVIRLFFSSEHQELYTIEASKRWYESFATICCMWSYITSATMIAVSEFFFYHSIRWVHHYRCRTKDARWLLPVKAKQ